MLVAGRNLYHHGKWLLPGDPIEDVENWRTSLPIHLQSGAIIDVAPEEAERLRGLQKAKDVLALGQRATRDYERARYATLAAHGQVGELQKQLEAAEKAFIAAEQLEFEAADKLAALRSEYSDEALGLGAEDEVADQDGNVAVSNSDDADGPEAPAEPTAEAKPSVLTPDELRSKAIGVVGGYTKAQLAGTADEKGMLETWWGVKLSELKKPDGTLVVPKAAKKDLVRDAAVAIFEARFRIAELAEALGLEGDDKPSDEVLLAVSLEAVGAVVPPQLVDARDTWTASIAPPKPEPDSGDPLDASQQSAKPGPGTLDEDATVVPSGDDT